MITAQDGGIAVSVTACNGRSYTIFGKEIWHSSAIRLYMSRIQEAFKNGKAFIPFITAGYPDLDTSCQIIKAAADNGADLIEIGIPFSDPTAEGPVIQTANVRALQAGVTTDKVFELVRKLREEITIPMVFMTYANVVYSYHSAQEAGVASAAGAAEKTAGGAAFQTGTAVGKAGADLNAANPAEDDTAGIERFCRRCAEVGIDGLILPDVPFEEHSEFSDVCEKYDLDLVPLIAPTSDDRIQMIAKAAKGFIYVVSSLGVTGVRTDITTDIAAITDRIREVTDVPCAVGFGISKPEQARKMAAQSDGAIVGSAIIRLIGQYGKDAAPEVGRYVREMKAAVREA